MMTIKKQAVAALLVAASLLSGCATPEQSALAETRREAVEADIDSIMTIELDPTEYGEVQRCLADNQYRTQRGLDDRHLLFEGRKGKQWINVLRGRCHDLDKDYIFIVRSATSSGKLCKLDQFQVSERLSTNGFGDLGIGPSCVLGEFKPVTAEQVQEIEKLLETL